MLQRVVSMKCWNCVSSRRRWEGPNMEMDTSMRSCNEEEVMEVLVVMIWERVWFIWRI